jgi:hypothetical protein
MRYLTGERKTGDFTGPGTARSVHWFRSCCYAVKMPPLRLAQPYLMPAWCRKGGRFLPHPVNDCSSMQATLYSACCSSSLAFGSYLLITRTAFHIVRASVFSGNLRLEDMCARSVQTENAHVRCCMTEEYV